VNARPTKNCESRNCKILKENKGKLHDTALDSDFMGLLPKAKTTKGKLLNFIKSKCLCASTDTFKRGERQPREWKKYLECAYLIRD
jgi:hypothetical protein